MSGAGISDFQAIDTVDFGARTRRFQRRDRRVGNRKSTFGCQPGCVRVSEDLNALPLRDIYARRAVHVMMGDDHFRHSFAGLRFDFLQ